MRNVPTLQELERFLAQLGPLGGGFTGAPVPEILAWEPEGMTLRLSYTLPGWMVNPGGMVHGGLITTLIDSAFGMLTCCAAGGAICPTISLTTNYLSSVTPEHPLIIEATIDRFGRSTAHLSAKCWQKDKLTNTASAVFSTASPRGTVPNQSE